MTQLALPIVVRHPLPPEVAEWWEAWKARPLVETERDWLTLALDVLRDTAILRS